LVLPFWYRLTWVVPDKGLLNGCVLYSAVSPSIDAGSVQSEYVVKEGSTLRVRCEASGVPSPTVHWHRGGAGGDTDAAAADDNHTADPLSLVCHTIRYDTIRDAILTCARKPTRVSLIYRTEPTTKKCKNRKTKSSKQICSEVTVNSLGNPCSESRRRKRKGCGGKDLQKRKVL